MAKTVKITWKDSTTPAVTHSTVYRDDVLLTTVPIGTEIHYDETAQEGVTYKYEIQGKTSNDESTGEVLDRNVDNITISSGFSISFTTSSKVTNWAFNNIVNNGDPIEWDADGGQVQTVSGNDSPVFNLENSGTVSVITGRSLSGFAALTQLYADNLLVSNADVLQATDLEDLSIEGDRALTGIDISTLTKLKNITVGTQSLTELDISNNIELTHVYAYANNLSSFEVASNPLLEYVSVHTNELPSNGLDKIVNDLAGFSVEGGTLDIVGNYGNLTSDSYVGYRELISRSWIVDVSSPPVPGVFKPIMTNFRVNDATPTHIHFDTPLGPVTGLTTQGFVVSGKNIISINTTIGYIEVDTPFTYWDNNTIRLGENSDTSHSQSVMWNFTMRKIANNLSEPNALVDRFISSSGSGDGTSEGNAASFSYALANAQAGQTWWMKVGTYSDVNGAFSNSGDIDSPIKIIGYKNTPGDIDSMYWNYGDAIDASELPLITSSSSSATGLTMSTKSNIIVRNIQISCTGSGSVNYKVGGCTNIIFDRALSYQGGEYGFIVWFANSNTTKSERVRITNSRNEGSRFASWFACDYGLLDDFESYSNSSTTYMLQGEGSYSIYNNVKLRRFVDNPSHTGHGFNFNIVNGSETAYNLCVDSEAMNTDKGLEFRKSNSHDNVCRNLNVGNNGGAGSEDTGGINFRDGCHNNIAENCTVETGLNSNSGAMRLEDSDEGGQDHVGNDNMIRNTLFKNNANIIIISSYYTSGSNLTRFKFYNNTIDNATRLIWQTTGSVSVVDSEFKNNLISNVSNSFVNGADSSWIFDSNNFHSNGFAAIGTNATEVNPDFDANFKPLAPFEDIDSSKLTMVTDDHGMNERVDPTTRGYLKSDGEVNVPDTTPPTLTSATVEDAAPTEVVMVFDETVTGTNLGFSLSGTTSSTFASISGSGSTWTGVLADAALEGESITLDYDDTVGDFEDSEGNALATFSGFPVTNNIGGSIADIYETGNAASFGSEANSTGTWFENYGNVTISSDSVEQYDGAYSIKIEALSSLSFDNRGEYDFVIENGATYQIKIWAKRGVGVNQTFNAWVGFSDFINTEITSTDWAEYVFNLTAISTAAKIRVYPHANGDTGDTVYLDKITIEKTS